MAAKSSPGGFVVATVTNPGSFMATITHPTGNGYCRDRILRDTPTYRYVRINLWSCPTVPYRSCGHALQFCTDPVVMPYSSVQILWSCPTVLYRSCGHALQFCTDPVVMPYSSVQILRSCPTVLYRSCGHALSFCTDPEVICMTTVQLS